MTSPTSDRRLGLVGNTAVKAPCKVVSTTNITLSGEQTIDGVAVLAENAAGIPDRVLVTGQTDQTANGIYDVGTGSWTRAKDCNNTYDVQKGTTLAVNQGSVNSGWWKVTASDPIVIGTTNLTWARNLNTPDDLTTAIAAAGVQAAAAAVSATAAAASATSADASVTATRSLFNRIYLGGY